MKTILKLALAVLCAITMLPTNTHAAFKKTGTFLGVIGATAATLYVSAKLYPVSAKLYQKRAVKNELTEQEKLAIRVDRSEARATKINTMSAASERLSEKRLMRSHDKYETMQTRKKVAKVATAVVLGTAAVATTCLAICKPEAFFRTIGFLVFGGLAAGSLYALLELEKNQFAMIALGPPLTMIAMGSTAVAVACVAQ